MYSLGILIQHIKASSKNKLFLTALRFISQNFSVIHVQAILTMMKVL